ncbi:type II secretion system F family protein [Jiangella endophytica]|uniref:type II secretion system F family protein n=1 Tax=Jiangella endophytica TaxID=1623398 RepID=UPI000E34AC85|nr:type II secretion system F family protein [Jiangella endophytica]
MTTTQLAVLLGLGSGAGLLVILRELVGRVGRLPHPVHAAQRLTGTADPAAGLAEATDPGGGVAARVGRAVLRRGARSSLLHVPYRDLALLRRSVAQFLGERAICAAIGLVLPTAASAALTIGGLRLPFVVPAITGPVAAMLLSFLPLYTVADLARAKRAEFRRAMATYIDLVALERAAGSGATQSLESAARIGQSWAFQRVRDELAHARWAGVPAWEALRAVGRELRLPELADTGDVMRMSAREGATVYDVLRARASAMRSELLTGDQARAGSRTERATAPLAATAVVFMLILAAPVAMRIG